MNERYAWAGGSELLHLTPGNAKDMGGASIIAALPPFEEANRTRALMATILRDLNTRGFTTALPDLPGQGESLAPTGSATLADWRTAFAAAAAALPGPVHAVTVRAGALVDAEAVLTSRWSLSPQGGDALARELTRLTDVDGLVAGNRVASDLLAGLTGADPATADPHRVVRLRSENKPADRVIDAVPLWRRAEPDNDAALATLLADDIAQWIASRTPSVRAEPVEARGSKPVLAARPSTSSGPTEFLCSGETLAGTLDAAPGTTGLLIVSGGNEIRIGAHRGMALLAQRVAASGYPVFRFDRRGIGDSTGTNGGFETGGPDIAAAAAHFRQAQPHLTRIVGFGNCDAATALALFGREAGIDAFMLANPWVVEGESDLPPPAAIRARYAAKLKDPRELWRLVSGGVNLAKLARGLKQSRTPAATGLADRLRATLPRDATILTARGDNTAIAFRAAFAHVPAIERDTDSHSFARAGDADWLFERVMERITPPRHGEGDQP